MNTNETVTIGAGTPHARQVKVAVKQGRTLVIERLINLDGLYGTVTQHGTLYKRTHDELVKALKWIYEVREVVVARTTLVP